MAKGCIDCKCYNYEAAYYMVKDTIWKEANGKDNKLCLYCLVKRLGRKLTKEDFTNVPCNKYLFSILECVE